MAKQFTLGKNERLKSRKQIELLFSEGKKFVVGPFRVIYLLNEMLNAQYSMFNIQFGVGVSAKNFKRAVDRNRIKRLTREGWRLQKNELKDKLAKADQQINVFFIYTSKEMPEYSLVFNKIGTAVKKLIEKIEQQGK